MKFEFDEDRRTSLSVVKLVKGNSDSDSAIVLNPNGNFADFADCNDIMVMTSAP